MDRQALPNRLLKEKSPYLLQHAHNPVHWLPWCPEAFAQAGQEQKPIFLSIGYSTCHWCHVMAHESFEDAEVAEALNRDFIPIKVDREERPDIDAVYMAVCQAFTGAGGWPLTILMTPEQKPFYAATYLPKRSRYGTLGLLELLAEIARLWQEDRASLLAAGDQCAALLRKQPDASGAQAEPNRALLRRARDQYAQAFNPQWGGFGPAPKFPAAHNLMFLLRYAALEQDDKARHMAEKTLEQMVRGGLFDHLGGGFSRYSTDDQWLIPHFEKMLYDNALLAGVYLEAYQRTEKPLYRWVAQATLDYVLRELTDEQGAFYCAQDADSDGVEGGYYAFTPEEVLSVLGKEDGTAFCRRFSITRQGNFEGKSIPNLLEAETVDEENEAMRQACARLYRYRLGRARLHRDDKVLTAWNALMIAALCRAARSLDAPRYLQAAERAMAFVDAHLTASDGRLWLRWRDGEAAHAGALDDYAFLGLARLALYRTRFDPEDLAQAVRLAKTVLARFADPQAGGLFLTDAEEEPLLFRPKETYDGAMPSGNAAAALLFGRLARLTGEAGWREACDRQLAFLAGAMQAYPAGYSVSLCAMLEALYPSEELICALAQDDPPPELTAYLRRHDTPQRAVLIKTPTNAARLAQTAPFTTNYPIPEAGARYYLCRSGACSAPVDRLEDLEG